MELNTQPVEKPRQFGGCVEVHSKWNTIQGEGPYAGRQAVFLRLAGCNLQCPLCDTLYADTRTLIPVDELAEWCRLQPPKLVVLTGGEPFRQRISSLCQLLLDIGKEVQVETNGTLYDDKTPFDVTVVCSPKTSKINPMMAGVVDAWKYVLRYDAIDPIDGLPTSALGMKSAPARPLNNSEVYL